MLFYVIYLENAYDTEDEISNRPLVRCYQKTGVSNLLEGYIPYVVAYVDERLFLREFFTTEVLRKSNFCNKPYSDSEDILKFNDLVGFKAVPISKEEVYRLLPLKRNEDFLKAIEKAVLKKDNDFPLSTPGELEEDEACQLEAYTNGLTTIHPYSDRYREIKALRHKR